MLAWATETVKPYVLSMTRYGIAALVLMLSVARHAPGQGIPDPKAANPERPTVATHAYAVAPGYVELEQGVRLSGHASPTEAGFWEINLKVGVAPWLQVAMTGDPFVQNQQGSGLGDLGATVKARTALSSRAAAALVASVSLPSGNQVLGLGTGRTLVNVVGVVSIDFASVFHVDVNAGPTGIGPGSPQWLGTAAWSWTPWRRGTFELETFGYTGGAAGPATQGLVTGFAYRVRPQAVVDGGGMASNGSAGLRQLFVGLTLNLGGLWGPPRGPR